MRVSFVKMDAKKKLLVRLVTAMIPIMIVFSVLTQTVFAMNVYVITDGDQRTVHTSFASDPARVLTEAGFRLEENDLYTTEATDGVSEITVQRARQIRVDYCGETLEAYSYGETVQSLLNRLGIPYSGEYRLNHPLTDQISDGMELSVEHVVYNTESYSEEIPYQTTVCYDDRLEAGVRKTVVSGVNGQVKKTANVLYVNSREQQRTVLEETVLQEAVEEIVIEGTGKNVDGKATDAPLIGNGVIITSDGEVLKYSKTGQFKATAYTHTDDGCNMTTATGTTVRTGVVAVDPRVIPYGTRMFIVSNDGKYVYGLSAAEDCGGAIKGNRLDLYFGTAQECNAFGVRNCTVYFLDDK